ncbi:centrosomal protein of 63 kDa-like [Portunus trituberculatus]|uniref:centrosomal protein of 63 kDa-like n=1 Tax=Portunus trituberculatus TaxID=210409 RepID=UPI001E1CB8EE|nr:centrosomal protein of 63 kDa-like [Portunus trituberculatus]
MSVQVENLLKEAQLLGYIDTKEIQEYVRTRQQEMRDERAAQREYEKEQREHEKQQREHEKQQQELEREKLAAEERRLEWEGERERELMRHEKEMLQLRLSSAIPLPNPTPSHQFPTHRLQVSKYVEGQEIEPFIERFEMVANTYQLKEDMKKVEFMNLFDGKPLNILHRLEAATRNYAGMKKALLQAYGKTVEDARSQFQSAMLQDKETVPQFHARLASYLDQWLEKDETPKIVDGIRDLMLRTQLEQSCPPDLVARMKTHKVKDMKTMVDMADAHFAAYGYNTRKQINKKFPNRHSLQRQESSSATPSIQSHQQLKQHQQSYERSKHQYRGG